MISDDLKSKILELYPEYDRVFGPYHHSDRNGRQNLILQNSVTDIRYTMQYAKALLEVSLSRRLIDGETVDHIDGNCANDVIDNLQVLSLVDNIARSSLRLDSLIVKCVWCDVEFEIRRLQRDSRGMNKAGPFCSRRCSGQYGASVQNGGRKLESKNLPPKTYYKLVDRL